MTLVALTLALQIVGLVRTACSRMPVLQCRRACMSCFQEIWKQLHRSRDRHLRLSGKAKDELWLASAWTD
jgi:hypothetical protein